MWRMEVLTVEAHSLLVVAQGILCESHIVALRRPHRSSASISVSHPVRLGRLDLEGEGALAVESRDEHANSIGGCCSDLLSGLEESILLLRGHFGDDRCHLVGHRRPRSPFLSRLGITSYAYVIPSQKS